MKSYISLTLTFSLLLSSSLYASQQISHESHRQPYGINNTQHSVFEEEKEEKEEKINPTDDIIDSGDELVNNMESKPTRVENRPKRISMNESTQETIKTVNKYLEYYGKFLKITMNNSFAVMEDYSNNTPSTVRSVVDKLAQNFDELFIIKKDTPKLFEKIFSSDDAFLTKSQRNLKKLYQNIAIELGEAKEAGNEIYHEIRRFIKIFANLDDYLPSSNKDSENTFNMLYVKSSKEHVIDVKNIVKKLENKQYDSVAHAIKQLKNLLSKGKNAEKEKQLKSTQAFVRKYIQTLIKTIHGKTNLLDSDVSIKHILGLQNYLNTLNQATECFFTNEKDNEDPLIDPRHQVDLNRQKILVYENVRSWMMTFIARINIFISTNNFAKAEERLIHVKKMNNILSEDIMNEQGDGNAQKQQEIIQSIQDIDDKIDKKLNNQIDKYRKIDTENIKHNPYILMPPETFIKKIEEAQDKNPRYSHVIEEIEKDIYSKIRSLTNKALENPFQADKVLNVCESMLPSLPEYMRKHMQLELKNSRTQITKRKEVNDNIVNESIEKADINGQCKLLIQMQVDQDFHNVYRLKEEIKKQIDNLSKKIKEHIKCDKIQEACQELMYFNQYQTKYAEILSSIGIKEQYEALRDTLFSNLKVKKEFIQVNLHSEDKMSDFTMKKMIASYNLIAQFDYYYEKANSL